MRDSESFIVAREPGCYHGWPSVARAGDGELVAVFSGGRRNHIDPFGRTTLVRSQDDGATWSWPEVINDSPLDDRDAGIVILPDGTWLLTWFTSLIFLHRQDWCRELYGDDEVDSWQARIDGATPEVVRRRHGAWTRRSVDRGRTWEPPVNAWALSPHGPAALADGRLLFVGGIMREDLSTVGVMTSGDQGRSWATLSEIEIPDGTDRSWFHEPHAVMTADGRLVCLFRFEIPDEKRADTAWEHDYMMQVESEDGGRTWGAFHQTPLRCHPPHLLRLRDDRLLVSYSGRYRPRGQRACLSPDHGRTWDVDRQLHVRDDAPNCDLGYPASVQLSDEWIYTVYYQVDQPGDRPCIMGTRWRLP